MKKLLSVLAVVCGALALAGCGGDSDKVEKLEKRVKELEAKQANKPIKPEFNTLDGESGFGEGEKNRKQAEIELAVLRTALDKFHHIHKSYPHCPQEICTPSETLFLSLIGFHNGKGSLTIKPKQKALEQESLFELNTEKYDPANVPEEQQSHKKFVAYLKSLLQRDIAFVDPWGTPYVYVQDRKGKGYQLYSKGPDGQTGEGFDADDVLLE